jgi:Arc/MetJ family transcription regulator
VATNLAIDDALLERAKRLGHHRTKREAVNVALREYVRNKELAKVVEAFGTIDFDPGWDPKAERRRR